MIARRQICVASPAGLVAVAGLTIGERLATPGAKSLVGTTEAGVGPPLTQVSVAGIGRRTAWRHRYGTDNR